MWPQTQVGLVNAINTIWVGFWENTYWFGLKYTIYLTDKNYYGRYQPLVSHNMGSGLLGQILLLFRMIHNLSPL